MSLTSKDILAASELPHSIEAERAVLGVILGHTDTRRYMSVMPDANKFFDENHQRIAGAIKELFTSGNGVDHLTIANRVGMDNLQYLMKLSTDAQSQTNYSGHCAIIEECYLRRTCIERGAEMVESAAHVDSKIISVISEHITNFHQLSVSEAKNEPSNEDLIHEVRLLQEEANTRGLYYPLTGIDSLDARLGVQRGNLVTIAGRQGTGKTMVVNTICAQAVKSRSKVRVENYEMLPRDMMIRLLAAISSTPMKQIKSDEKHVVTDLGKYADQIMASEVTFVESSGKTSDQLIADIWAIDEPDVVVIDHIGLIPLTGKSYNQAEDLGKLTTQLKMLAKKKNCVIIVLSQINRAADISARPTVNNLRGSGRIAEDSDLVLLLHREQHLECPTMPPDQIDIIIAKQRDGEHGGETISCKFEGALGRISEYEGIPANNYEISEMPF